MVSPATERQLKPWESEPEPEPDPSVIPEDRVYVFYPEGENAIVNIGGRHLVKFTNGRLMSDIDKLSSDDLKWLGQQRRTDGQPKYLFCLGDPRKDLTIRGALTQRFSRIAATKAAALEALAIVDDIEFMVYKALYVPGDEWNGAERLAGPTNVHKVIEAFVPNAFESIEAQMAQQTALDQARDAEVIAQSTNNEDQDPPATPPWPTN